MMGFFTRGNRGLRVSRNDNSCVSEGRMQRTIEYFLFISIRKKERKKECMEEENEGKIREEN